MDFTFSPEQRELQEQARSFLERRFPPTAVARLAESEEGWDPSSWNEIAALGWLGVSVPEDEGGAGLGFVEEAILLEEFGRCLYPGPFFATVGLARPAIPLSSLFEMSQGKTRWSTSLGPDARLVVDLNAVQYVIVSKGNQLWVRRAVGSSEQSIDSTRRMGRLGGADEGELIAQGPEAARLLAEMRVRRSAALALESVGVAQRVLEWGLEHARTREQFGRPIGSYQAISHPLVDSFVEVELARSLAYWAAWCIGVKSDQAAAACSAAHAAAVEAAIHSCERVIQVHGGMGFTWESPLHRYYKRALWAGHFGGAPGLHRRELALALLAGDGVAEGEDHARAKAGPGGSQS